METSRTASARAHNCAKGAMGKHALYGANVYLWPQGGPLRGARKERFADTTLHSHAKVWPANNAAPLTTAKRRAGNNARSSQAYTLWPREGYGM